MQTLTINDIVGHQPMNNPATESEYSMFYIKSHKENNTVTTEICRFIVFNGEGYISARDILLKLNPATTHLDLDHKESTILGFSNMIGEKSRRGIGNELMVDGIGTFVAYSGSNMIDRPIFSYVDKAGLTRYIPSPEFEKLVVRVC
jgi:hypothetical protein